MSQRNETVILVLSLVITMGLVGAGIWWITKSKGINLGSVSSEKLISGTSPTANASDSQLSIGQRLSIGKKLLIPEGSSQKKQEAVQAIASLNYNTAIANLEASLQASPNDPEALIYLNNARIGDKKSYTIAVAVPIGKDMNPALEILRGVAQAQNELNQSGGLSGIPLKVLIANDDNNPEIASQIASDLAKNSEVLGVIGHFGSDTTLAASKVYQQNQLVAISPTSTSVQLSGVGSNIFRTVPSDRFAANALSRYMLTKLQKKKAVVFFNSASSYSKSLKNEFTTAVYADGGQIVSEFDLTNPNFNAAESVKKAIAQGAEVIMLASNSSTIDQALQVVQVNAKRLPLLAGDGAYTAKILQIGGAGATNMVLAIPWHILADPQSNFPQTSKQLWKAEVNWRTALAYDAATALIAGLRVNPTRTGIQQALSASDFSATGASGAIRFLPSGDRNRAVQLVTVKPGNRTSYGYDFVPISGSGL
ncbi:MAG: ABC transporter substrate-binding protein [Tychonema bourrellyi B0820]|uniref:Receptor ligand binding family protein n=1 Tax=Tychonema bourrellyi FEM_GT703 TaxID=2040638 RepID=A0A2G4EW39_9CYAN|nr:ABC transporter substrate-binding protein [Tychonema bourrellyi]MDQ2098885.1 ABC transporter substrate-binding protein [Tychonema bourrellyi B0820]PHX53688.1 receptor ligand binding family protein [Tychonema bourrellyi FEM_GT703]